MTDAPFWKTKTLKEMSEGEWESLCDGCAKCCLIKMEDIDTGDVYFTGLHCRLLNPGTCTCSNYAERQRHVEGCVKLTPDNIGEIDWLPKTCAYLLVHQGKDLEDWHHLVCGDRNEVHRRGMSAKGKTRTEVGIADEDAFDYVIDWAHGPPPPKRRRKRK
ncbi:MAG: YcgN family cysteine cluster protein [Alphaproteobacteria bacterium]|nr:YcgN family cysteine cluster protein [Alphaproteobacteria bacterium]